MNGAAATHGGGDGGPPVFSLFEHGFSWYPCEKDDSDVVPARWKVGDKAECWGDVVLNFCANAPMMSVSKIARSPAKSLENSQATATWCLWALSALSLALVAVMIWVCFYKPPRQGPLDYLPISEGQRGEAGQT